MNKLLFTCCITFLTFTATGQHIQKMSIAELENYIASRPGPAVVNFWATWCVPCLEEMPWFNETIKNFSNKDIELILVSLDNQKAYPEKIQSIVNKRKMKATFIWLNESNADYFCPKIDPSWSGSIPATLFVNHSKERKKFLEQQVSPSQLTEQLRLLTE